MATWESIKEGVVTSDIMTDKEREFFTTKAGDRDVDIMWSWLMCVLAGGRVSGVFGGFFGLLVSAIW